MKINALIVDDEPLARERVRTLLETESDVDVLGECASGPEALEAMRVCREQGVRFGVGEARWKRSDGVYSFRNDIQSDLRRLPHDARVVFFHGSVDPWSPYAQLNCPWVREHYH